jgi:hypothetical protein
MSAALLVRATRFWEFSPFGIFIMYFGQFLKITVCSRLKSWATIFHVKSDVLILTKNGFCNNLGNLLQTHLATLLLVHRWQYVNKTFFRKEWRQHFCDLGVNVMITFFGDFHHCSAKNSALFLKTNVMIKSEANPTTFEYTVRKFHVLCNKRARMFFSNLLATICGRKDPVSDLYL